MDGRWGLRKETVDYKQDHVLDLIDVNKALDKNKIIEKIKEELFIYKKKKPIVSTPKKSKKIDWNNIIFELDNLKEVPATDYFGDFRQIGEGAFGVVYSAIDKKMLEKVAIKVRLRLYKFVTVIRSCLSQDLATILLKV